MRIWADQWALTCEVADGIRATQTDVAPLAESSSSDAADLPVPLPWPVEPGHGLWLVGKVADRLVVRLDDHGATAAATFVLRH